MLVLLLVEKCNVYEPLELNSIWVFIYSFFFSFLSYCYFLDILIALVSNTWLILIHEYFVYGMSAFELKSGCIYCSTLSNTTTVRPRELTVQCTDRSGNVSSSRAFKCFFCYCTDGHDVHLLQLQLYC